MYCAVLCCAVYTEPRCGDWILPSTKEESWARSCLCIKSYHITSHHIESYHITEVGHRTTELIIAAARDRRSPSTAPQHLNRLMAEAVVVKESSALPAIVDRPHPILSIASTYPYPLVIRSSSSPHPVITTSLYCRILCIILLYIISYMFSA